MGVIKFDDIKFKKPEPIFGIVLPKLIESFYYTSISEQKYEENIKSVMNIHPNRLIKLQEAVYGEKYEVLLLIIYDKLVTNESFIKEKVKLKVIDFNFPIYNYDFNSNIDIEKQINEG